MQPVAAESAEQLRLELLRTTAELQRRVWALDPVLWARERLGYELWWGQKDIARALLKHRRVAVQSANGIGKTNIAAVIACWWLDIHKPGEARVVSSAATMQQVETRLWSEIHSAHAAGDLPGRLNLASWIVKVEENGRFIDKVVGVGVKPADNDPSAIKGWHAPYVLVIFDEAQAMDAALWTAAGTITTSANCRFLAIGNPDTPLCRFYEICRPNSGWHHIALSAFDSPNFFTAFEPGTFKPERPLPEIALNSLSSPQFVEELVADWGIDHPFYVSQVEGKFPETSEDTLIRLDWIRRAQKSNLEPSGAVEFGVDVGGGVASSTIVLRNGPVASIDRVRSTPDTSQVTEDIIVAHRKHEPSLIKVDAVGIGNGIAATCASGQILDGYGRPLKLPILAVNVGGSANDKENYGDLRAEGYWQLRELFRTGQIRIPNGTPEAERLAGELAGLKYRTLAGRIYVESKKDMKSRGLRSPDLADALMMAFMTMPITKKHKLTWGSGKLGAGGTRVGGASSRRRRH